MYRSLTALFVLLSAAIGCSGAESPATPTPTPAVTLSDFVGSWSATSVVHTNKANPAQTFDIIAAGGEVRFTMLVGGGTRTWVELGTYADEWDALVTLSGSTVTSVPVEASRPTIVASVTLANGVLTMTNANAMFDFALTGATGVPTSEVSTFVRSQ